MNKVVWITVIDKVRNEDQARKLYQTVGRYGLSPAGHFWEDNLEQMAWTGARDDLLKKETALWIIMASAEGLAKETVRYGLSLLALGVQSRKGHGFPVMIVLTAGELQPGSLPTALKGVEILTGDPTSLGPKITAKANLPVKKVPSEYRLDAYGLPGIGQWFEVGPMGRSWTGAMFGVCGGEINAHGVGEAHKLPERCILEYPMKGLKLQVGQLEYTAWAVKNTLADEASYYLRVNGFPSSLLFGPMSEGDDAEVFLVDLK
jgi:hypothetical protein